jgi:GH18 family chitinase
VCQERRLDGIDLDWEYPNGGAQQQGYADLLGELRKAFEPHKLTLSVTISASQKLPPAAFDAADWVQVMSYDHSGRHSTYDNAVRDVKSLRDRGIAPEKIVLGIPFYGRHIRQRDKALSYREILAKHEPEPTIDEIEGVYFNGPDTVKRKTAYALDSKLGGVMVWELGHDARSEQSLLKKIRETVVDTQRQ